MRIYEIFNPKKDNKFIIKKPAPQNIVAISAKRLTNAGPHEDKKFSRKEKHKKKDYDE